MTGTRTKAMPRAATLASVVPHLSRYGFTLAADADPRDLTHPDVLPALQTVRAMTATMCTQTRNYYAGISYGPRSPRLDQAITGVFAPSLGLLALLGLDPLTVLALDEHPATEGLADADLLVLVAAGMTPADLGDRPPLATAHALAALRGYRLPHPPGPATTLSP